MKINFIMPGLGDSGGMKVIRTYAELMKKAGEDVVIYCPIKAFNLHRYNSKPKNKVHQFYCTLKTLLETLMKNKSGIQWIWSVNGGSIRKADVTIATLWATAFHVFKLPDKCGKKFYFIQGYEIWDNEEFAKQSYLLSLNKIVISAWINQRLKQELNIGPFPVVINGIDSFFFSDRKVNKDKPDIYFLMLNHILPKKGVKNGLIAFEKIRKIYPQCHLRMFGTCSSDNLPNWVEYYRDPSKEKLLSLYSSSDIFIFPSLEEGWGLTPLEAMASKCAVVGTNTGFVLDLGVDHENMLISTPGDIDKMVYNFIELIEDIKLREKIQLNGYETVKKLNWNVSTKSFLTLLYGDENIC